ncbi:hypothetical protein WN51_10035 [Melipona quadrifasciata]|uniref:Uncharacterized protein n=1 Tax=Melipona quadrifasciata TaxID=166423 RepID=A0A0M9ABJ5_9HYME|nr:hypothetical protein WN51_10035 [Melipona quadrifasciata]
MILNWKPKESPNVFSVPLPSASENRGSKVGHEWPDTHCRPEASRWPVLLTCSGKLVPLSIHGQGFYLFLCLEESAAMCLHSDRGYRSMTPLPNNNNNIFLQKKICSNTLLMMYKHRRKESTIDYEASHYKISSNKILYDFLYTVNIVEWNADYLEFVNHSNFDYANAV